MNRSIALVLIVLIGFSLIRMVSGPDAAVISVKVDPTKVPGRIGKEIEFDIYVSGVDTRVVDLFGWGLRVNWTDVDFNFVSVEEGPFLKEGGGSTFFVSSTSTSGGVETLSLGNTLLGRVPGVRGEGVLATIKLYVVAGTQGSRFVLSNVELYNSEEYLIAPPRYNVIVFDEAGEFARVPRNEDIVPPYGVIDVLDLGVIGANYDRNIVSARKIPTAWTNLTSPGWLNPHCLGASDDNYASSSTNGASSNWTDFRFAVNTTLWTGIDKVRVGLEALTTVGGEDNITISMSNNNGTTWSGTYPLAVTGETDTFAWVDVTSAYSWTPTMIRSIAVKLTYTAVGTATTIYIDYLVVAVSPRIGASPSPVPEPDAFDPDADVNNDLFVDIEDLIAAAISYGSYPLEED